MHREVKVHLCIMILCITISRRNIFIVICVTMETELCMGDRTKARSASTIVKKIRMHMKAPQSDSSDATSMPLNVESDPSIKPIHTEGVDLLPRVCFELKISYPDQMQIKRLMERSMDLLTGKQPKTVVAASILFYLAEIKNAPHNGTQIARVCGADYSSVRNSRNILRTQKSFLDTLPPLDY